MHGGTPWRRRGLDFLLFETVAVVAEKVSSKVGPFELAKVTKSMMEESTPSRSIACFTQETAKPDFSMIVYFEASHDNVAW